MAQAVRTQPAALRMQGWAAVSTKPINGSFAPVKEGEYVALCDKGPWHGRWYEAHDFRFDLMEVLPDGRSRRLGRYVYQFGIWIWHGF